MNAHRRKRPGKGYRLLVDGEWECSTDEWWDGRDWVKVSKPLRKHRKDWCETRRKIGKD
jgi:hypothetical protein